MQFIGQKHIMKELAVLLPHLLSHPIESANILLRGASGHGKTRMALLICNYLTQGRFYMGLGDNFKFYPKFRVHFLDEVHLMKEPEVLYPLMDSNKYIFILATNDAAILREALVNRCIRFQFHAYSKAELRYIIKQALKFKLHVKSVDYLIKSGGGNPRIILGFVKRLNLFSDNMPIPEDLETFKSFLEDIMGIEDGLDVSCNAYIETLKGLGGRASLETMASMLRVDKDTIRFEIEPVLLYNGKITISPKGRTIC